VRLRRFIEGPPQSALHPTNNLVGREFIIATHAFDIAWAGRPLQPPRPFAILVDATQIQGASPLRDDLLDAQAALNWAETEIPRLQNALLQWTKDPYRVVKEPDPDYGGYAIVACERVPFPLIFNAWTGAIINSLRSVLDLVAASLASRNGVKPSHCTHFPIFRSLHDMIDPIDGLESKKWLSKNERSTIEALRPYKGGDDTIWPLHRLDILRKHERLIYVRPIIGFRWTVRRDEAGTDIMIEGRELERLENKTILFRYQTASEILSAAQGETRIAAHVAFGEFALGIPDQELVTVLIKFRDRIAEIIMLFDSP
jgi:hypothetical protein